MYSDARNWKWMLPAVIMVVLFVTSMLLYGNGEETGLVAAMYGFGLAAVFGLGALVNFIKFVGEFMADQLLTRKRAMSMSVDAQILANIKGVHPETIRLVFGERQRAWMLKAGMDLPEDTAAYSVLYARPDVTEMFFFHFLRHSNTYRCMPARELNDKAYNFDPLRKATDREQYDMIVDYFQQRGILTMESASNGTPLWITPWTPALVADDFGYEWDESEQYIPNLVDVEGA